MWKRILVPLDGSNLAELALAYAEELAVASSSEITLLYASEPKESQYRHMQQLYMDGVAEQVGEKVKERAKVNIVVLDGEPATEIINYAEKNKVSVIIMTSRGRSGTTAWAIGSVANKVLQAAKLPVLLIKAGKAPQRILRKPLLSRVLLPLDGSEAGEAAVPYIEELAGKLGSEVVLFRVVPAGQHVRTIGGLDYIFYPEPELELVKAEAREYLNQVQHRLKGKVRVELKVGEVAQEIINFAQKAKVSLIAMSAHGHSGIEKWIFGSTASKVLQASDGPVLVVRVSRG
jgi:nucleotide-binding universal stress UspA family protein